MKDEFKHEELREAKSKGSMPKRMAESKSIDKLMKVEKGKGQTFDSTPMKIG